MKKLRFGHKRKTDFSSSTDSEKVNPLQGITVLTGRISKNTETSTMPEEPKRDMREIGSGRSSNSELSVKTFGSFAAVEREGCEKCGAKLRVLDADQVKDTWICKCWKCGHRVRFIIVYR